MKKTWLVLDVHYLCHRAFHTARGLSWKGRPTGVIYSFLKSIQTFKDEFGTDRIAFCFEHPHLFRRDIYPGYKRRRHRRQQTSEQKKAHDELTVQIDELRLRHLPKLGFKNIFYAHGFEADDLLAAIAHSLKNQRETDVVLVTADSDLYQCLAPNVMIYSPQKQKLFTEKWFINHYGFRPRKWAMLKAITGCKGDEVPGISGIGEVTAVKIVRGELPPDWWAYQAVKAAEQLIKRNLSLVKLPFKPCPVPTLQEDKVDREAWKELCKLLGMRSLINRPPIYA